ncbi:hypothetical protein C4D60_Mb08t15590 [Musa balbisiana]|uniref:Uncharacterized protein n=1 Tax=Musa balbisiana TaxID=52838 RepID=A0A4S8K409_MUSBA|nr:hypothetical protein C4D60_Mb08t15590 [Musa balbisiana]
MGPSLIDNICSSMTPRRSSRDTVPSPLLRCGRHHLASGYHCGGARASPLPTSSVLVGGSALGCNAHRHCRPISAVPTNIVPMGTIAGVVHPHALPIWLLAYGP